MSPRTALLLYFIFLSCILLQDFKFRLDLSHALWIPTIWMMISGSRLVSQWLNLGTSITASEAYLSGSPHDRIAFIMLIIAGLFILYRRKIPWLKIIKRNVWIFLFFLYCGISILWTDFPGAIFRKWFKQIGEFIMVLVVVTDHNSIEASKAVIRTCTFVLIPLSIVFIKYYLHLGRLYDPWEGMVVNIGVATSKNSLGRLCLISGLFFFWNFYLSLNKKKGFTETNEILDLVVQILYIIMILWLFIKVNSVTSLLCLIIGISVIIGLGFSFIKRNIRSIELYLFLSIFIFLILQSTLNIMEIIISSLGRNMTLTGRTFLWKDIINLTPNPMIGAGYESFWLGERLTKIWTKYWWQPNQAHNGYIEIYLNLGIIGLFLLIMTIFSTYRNIRKTLLFNFDYGRFQLAFLAIYLLYNITEFAFKTLNLMWFVFLLCALDIPQHHLRN